MEIEDRLTTMEKRLHNQEKRLRYHRITVGILVLFIMLMVGTRVGANSGEVTCTQLNVVDAEGKMLVALGAHPVDGNVSTSSSEGKPQVILHGDAGGGYVSTRSPEGKKPVVLDATPNGEGMVATFSPEEKVLVALGATNGNGGVWTGTKSGRAKRLD